MVDKKKLLDEAMRREGRLKPKKLLTYTLLALIFGSFFSYSVIYNYDRVKFSKELAGVVQSINVSSSLGEELRVYQVRLENNKIVEVQQGIDTAIEQGAKIKVLRQELESGKMRYSIIFSL